MNFNFYLDTFHKAADRINKKILQKKQIEVAVGLYGETVFLKLYKKQWASSAHKPLTAESRIFFSVWITDDALKEEKLFYNIHALKLRKLKGYVIESRKFADAFRMRFREFEHRWKNASVNFGPLTLMEGWVKTSSEKMQEEILKLASHFLEIDFLIDETLGLFIKV